MPPLINNLTKGDEVPSVINGALFADNANGFLYLYGGEAPEGTTPDPFNLWRYEYGLSLAVVVSKDSAK